MYFSLRGKQKTVEHVSRFFITINTNKTDIKQIKPLKQAYEGFYQNLDRFITYLDPSNKMINEITDDPVIGIGKTYNRVHIHSLITIKHNSKIHLNFDKIRKYFSKYLGYTIHFDCRAVKDFEINIKQYLMKNYQDAINQNL